MANNDRPDVEFREIQPGWGWSRKVFEALHLESSAPAIISLTEQGFDTWTRADLLQYTAAAIAMLDDLQLEPGQAVPALLSARPQSVGFLLAGSFSGRPLAPLGPRLTERELLACLANLPGNVLLADADSAGLATTLAHRTGCRVAMVPERVGNRPARLTVPSADGTAVVMHTSGTTGTPKQVHVPELALANRAKISGELLALGPGARLVIGGLFHHIAGVGNVAAGLANDTTLILYPAFSVDVWRRLGEVTPTHAITVPSVIEVLLAADELALPNLQVLYYGASPIHPDTLRRIQQRHPHIELVQMFGQTEGSPLTVLTAEDHRLAVAGNEKLLTSVGRAVPGATLRISSPGSDGIGEVWAHCGHSFVVDVNGWQHTGDMGYLDDGYLYLTGRKGDMIISGGENVFPIEVERVLERHPRVSEAAVVGYPDRRLGEAIRAYVVAAHPARPLDVAELRTFCRSQLAGFKVPGDWRIVSDLPRNAVGKLLRHVLSDKGWGEPGRALG